MNPGVLTLLMRPSAGQNDVLASADRRLRHGRAHSCSPSSAERSPSGLWNDPEAPIYHALAAIALVLLIVPARHPRRSGGPAVGPPS